MTRARRAPRALRLAAAVAVAAGALAAAPAVGSASAPAARAADSTSDTQCKAGTYSWIAGTPPAFAIMQTDIAWPITKGAGVTVAVVDSGVDAANEHLVDAVQGGTDLVGDGAGANGLADLYGHGTIIAGVVAGRQITDHDSGVVGVAPEAHILSVRFYRGQDDESVKAGFGPQQARLAEAIRYSADQGAQIINVSLSTTVDDPGVRDAVAYATAHGSLIVASAGNRSTADDKSDGVRYPAGNDGVVGVGSLNASGALSAASIRGPQVALVAPGENVLSAYAGGGDCTQNEESASTSYATGYVAGAAALVAAAHPDETPAQWAYRLEASALRPDPDHRDDDEGWGVVQPYEAITLEPGPGTRGPASPFADTSKAAPSVRSAQVAPDHRPPAFTLTQATTVLIAVVGATLLGTFGVLTVLLRRRRESREG